MGLFKSIFDLAKNSVEITTKGLDGVNNGLNKFNNHLSILNFEKKIDIYFLCLKHQELLYKQIHEFNSELWDSINRFRTDENKISGKDKLNKLKQEYIKTEVKLKDAQALVKQMAYDLYGTKMLNLTVTEIRDYHYKNKYE